MVGVLQSWPSILMSVNHMERSMSSIGMIWELTAHIQSAGGAMLVANILLKADLVSMLKSFVRHNSIHLQM